MSTCRWIPLCDVLILVLEGGQKGLPSLFDCARRSGRGGGRMHSSRLPCLAHSHTTLQTSVHQKKHIYYATRSSRQSPNFPACSLSCSVPVRLIYLISTIYLSIYTHEPRRPSRPLEAHPKESGINRPGFELGHAVCWKGLVLCWRTRWARRAAVFGRWAPVFLA